MLGTTNINAYSVYEQDNGTLCVVITSNIFNADANTVVAARIIDEAADENDKFYHIPYDAMILNTIVEKKILLDCQFNIKISRLKKYLYTLNDSIAAKMRVALGRMIFGEEVFTIAEARNAIAREELKMRIELEQQYKGLPEGLQRIRDFEIDAVKEEKEAPMVYDNHSGIDSVQNSYAKNMIDDDLDLDINYNDYIEEEPEDIPEKIEYDRIIDGEYVPPFSQKFIDKYPECIEPYGIEHSIPVEMTKVIDEQQKVLSRERKLEKAKKSKVSKCLTMSNGSIATIVTKKPKTERKKYNSKYSFIYDNAANFLDQYVHTEDKEKMAQEYNLKDVKTMMNLASKCKKKLIEEKEFELLDIIGIDYNK